MTPVLFIPLSMTFVRSSLGLPTGRYILSLHKKITSLVQNVFVRINTAIKVMKYNKKPFALFCRYANNHKNAIIRLTLVYIASTAILVLAPQTLSLFIDRVHGGGGWHSVAFAIALYLAAMVAQSIMNSVLDYQLTSVGQRLTDEHRRDIMKHFLSLDAQHLSDLTSGEIITRLNQDAPGLFNYYYILFYKLAGSGLALIGILISLSFRVGWLSSVLLVVSILAILGFKAIQDRGIPKYVRRSKASAAFNGLLKETLDNSPTLRALKAESYADIQTQDAMKTRFKDSFPASLMYANLWSASTIMQAIVIASGLLLALLLWDAGNITLGVAYLIYTYCELIISPLQDFRNHMGNMQSAKAGILRSVEFLNLPLLICDGNSTLTSGAIDLVVEDVYFAYENGEDVLKGVNLSLPAGGRMGIMGGTGCGKSTLMSLIARLNTFERGMIRLGGVDINTINYDALRERVAYCTQRVQLIHGTIRDNIVLFDERYTDKDIWEAIELLGLTDWFQNFPDSLNTTLDMGEGNLSSGEAQLLSLVRLTLRQPGLVLLDEITSNLDAATERRVINAIEAMCKGRTVLSIAHNAEALTWMHNISRMDNGILLAPSGTGGSI